MLYPFALNADKGVVVGGNLNKVLAGADVSSILGGYQNTVSGAYSAIVSGSSNTITLNYAAVFGCNVTTVADNHFLVKQLYGSEYQ